MRIAVLAVTLIACSSGSGAVDNTSGAAGDAGEQPSGWACTCMERDQLGGSWLPWRDGPGFSTGELCFSAAPTARAEHDCAAPAKAAGGMSECKCDCRPSQCGGDAGDGG